MAALSVLDRRTSSMSGPPRRRPPASRPDAASQHRISSHEAQRRRMTVLFALGVLTMLAMVLAVAAGGAFSIALFLLTLGADVGFVYLMAQRNQRPVQQSAPVHYLDQQRGAYAPQPSFRRSVNW